MARQQGANTKVMAAFESTYGVTPATGFREMRYTGVDIDPEQPLIASPVLGQGRDPVTPFLDVITNEGSIGVPVDVRYIGVWLKLIFGSPVTVEDSGVYTHTFKSGAATLPSISMEKQFPQVPAFPMTSGVMGNSIAFNFQRTGAALATVGLLGRGTTESATSNVISPETFALKNFSQFQGSLKENNTLLANVTDANFTYNNNLEAVQTIRSDGSAEGIDISQATLTGNLNVRYADNVLFDKARSGTPLDLEFAYEVDADNKLVMTVHEAYLPAPKRNVDGPGGVSATYDFQGAKNESVGNMITVVLTNDVADYD